MGGRSRRILRAEVTNLQLTLVDAERGGGLGLGGEVQFVFYVAFFPLCFFFYVAFFLAFFFSHKRDVAFFSKVLCTSAPFFEPTCRLKLYQVSIFRPRSYNSDCTTLCILYRTIELQQSVSCAESVYSRRRWTWRMSSGVWRLRTGGGFCVLP